MGVFSNQMVIDWVAQQWELNKEDEHYGEILTYTGIFMDPIHPEPDQVVIEDIAHALSMICRANGHFPEVHTVAQHCLECYEEAKARGLSKELQLFCLIHDGAEAYLGDFVHPVKMRMKEYEKIEDVLLNMIYKKFAGRKPSAEEEAVVKEIDKTLLYFEFLHYMGVECGEPGQGLKSQPVFQEMPRQEVEQRYLATFQALTTSPK